MADQETLHPDIHSEAALLPWYLNGTLREDERRQVAQHLAECPACRSELEELSRLCQQMKEAYADLPGPSPQVFRSVMTTIRQELHLQPDSERAIRLDSAGGGSWLDALDRWLRPVFTPRWVPTLAATLIIGQLALLLWIVGQEPVGPPRDGASSSGGAVSRGIPTAMVRLRLAFQDTAPEQKIRMVIQDLKGRIVDGPSLDGLYTVEVPAGDPAALDRQLKALRNQPNLLRVAERLNP